MAHNKRQIDAEVIFVIACLLGIILFAILSCGQQIIKQNDLHIATDKEIDSMIKADKQISDSLYKDTIKQY